jgi:hypothetical protein
MTAGTFSYRYENLITPKPAAVPDTEFALSIAPVLFVLAWPVLLQLEHLATGGARGLGPAHAFLQWLWVESMGHSVPTQYLCT